MHKYLHASKPASVPTVYVSVEPADLIYIQGKPVAVPIAGTSQLSYIENTDSDLFQWGYGPGADWFVLLSGRWYKSNSLNGPWTFATENLPADFAKIPVNSARGRVLVSVPGTTASQYTGISSQIPQIASVHPANAKLEVTYAGNPSFKPIEGTQLEYAANTSYDVIKVSDREYYSCYSGVWFVASDPKGPWAVARYVPPAIYQIPPSSPLYQDTYVHIYNPDGSIVTAEQTPEPANEENAAILVGFTAGYLSSYWWNGAWMWGTGWYYPPYYYGGIYYGYPVTWTGGSWYNSATGAYGRYAGVYGPYGGAAARSYYNPTTGTYARGAAAYGPNGAVGGGSFYNPRYGVGGKTIQGSSPYGSWGRSAVSTPNGGAITGHASGSAGSVGRITTKNGSTTIGKSNATGDVYAGRDGNVLSQRQDGSWQKYDNGDWNSVNKPSNLPANTNAAQNRAAADRATQGGRNGTLGDRNGGSMQRPAQMPAQRPAQVPSNLNRDFSARQAGGGYRGFSGGGGFRGGGGGFRGGRR